MQFIAVEDYTSQYDKPVILIEGDIVSVGERYIENPDWPGWIWCETREGVKGWVPERIIKITGNTGIVFENYSALELTVKTGDVVEPIRSEGGWTWCRKYDGAEGWVPEKNIKIYAGD